MIRVLFICHGNICRSPMAEFVLKDMVSRRGMADQLDVYKRQVLGGAAVMMFSSIVISGIQLITKEPLTARNITIVSTALGLGYGIGANGAVIAGLPEAVQLIFGGSGIVPAAILAL